MSPRFACEAGEVAAYGRQILFPHAYVGVSRRKRVLDLLLRRFHRAIRDIKLADAFNQRRKLVIGHCSVRDTRMGPAFPVAPPAASQSRFPQDRATRRVGGDRTASLPLFLESRQ